MTRAGRVDTVPIDEAASIASDAKIEVRVIEAGGRALGRVVSAPVSEAVQAAHEARGVTFSFNEAVVALHSTDGHVSSVELGSGERIPADLVLVSIGVVPNSELAAACGLTVHNGVVVDAQLLTEDINISSIGDCAAFPFAADDDRMVRLESVQNAVDQARCVADRLTGKVEAYDQVPTFWSDQAGLRLQMAGLARGDEEARILLTTFSEELARSLASKLDLLVQGQGDLGDRITVRTLDQAAEELYTAQFSAPTRATASQIRAIIAKATSAGLGGELTPQFLLEEWIELVDAWGVTDAESYATIPRIGRRTRLGPRQRETAWAVFDDVRQRLTQRGLVTWAMIYGQLTEWLRDGGALPFNHVVVDEAQDLTVAQVRFLAEAVGGRADALFLAGDIGQRIFRLPFSWAKLGLDIRGRSHTLKVNYRTSHQIRAMADRLLPPSITDMDGVEEGRRGTVSVFDGPAPDIRLLDDEQAEIACVAAWLKECTSERIAGGEIGILVRSEGQFSRARDAIAAANVGNSVRIATMHDAKGLEFRAVAVMACDEDVLPDPVRLAAIGDIAELETAFETERHLLYVACTRARDRLLVTGIKPGSEFLDDLRASDTA